jgi:hypothetical protein
LKTRSALADMEVRLLGWNNADAGSAQDGELIN